MDNKLQQQMDFIIEIDKLKRIERRTSLIGGARLENSAEHSWHLAMMALILHKHANNDLDLSRVLQMLLVHDIVEIDAGDTFAYDIDGYADKLDREMKAAKRLFGLLPAEQAQEMLELWLEFERQETHEAKFAASLDRLQPLIHNHHNQGDTWNKHGISSEQVFNRNREIAEGSAALWEFAEQLIQKSVDQGILKK